MSTPTGEAVRDPEELLRLKQLAIPPAWQEVWICTDPLGHLQATGIDAAGRKQYLYHPRWREQRDRQKFDHMVDFAHALPTLRRRVLRTLRGSEELDRERGCSRARCGCSTSALFRIGTEQYADEEGGRRAWPPSSRPTSPCATARSSSTTSGKGGHAPQQAVQDDAVRSGRPSAQAAPRRR